MSKFHKYRSEAAYRFLLAWNPWWLTPQDKALLDALCPGFSAKWSGSKKEAQIADLDATATVVAFHSLFHKTRGQL